MRSGTGTLSTSLQPGISQIPQKLRKLMFIGTCTGMVSATSRPPSSRGAVAGRELARHPVGLAGVDGEHVPVERAVGRRAHRAEQLDLVVGELVEAALHDALERGARVRAGLLAHGDELLGRGPAAGDGLAVAVAVRRRLREREAERAGLERAAELGAHLGDLLGRGLAADRVGTHHVAADGAVPDEEAGVDRDRALEAVEVLAEGLPLPVDALLQRGEGHALDPGHHPAQVVGVAVVQRREA